MASKNLELSETELDVAAYGIEKLGDDGWNFLVLKFARAIVESVVEGGNNLSLVASSNPNSDEVRYEPLLVFSGGCMPYPFVSAGHRRQTNADSHEPEARDNGKAEG